MPGCQQVILLNGSSHDAVRTTLSWLKDQAALDDYRHSELFGIVWPQTKKMFVSEPVAWSLDWPLGLGRFATFPVCNFALTMIALAIKELRAFFQHVDGAMWWWPYFCF